MPLTDTITQQCHAFKDLAVILDKCSDDYGYIGCAACNIYCECHRWYDNLNKRLENGVSLRAHEYTEFARQFENIKKLRVFNNK